MPEICPESLFLLIFHWTFFLFLICVSLFQEYFVVVSHKNINDINFSFVRLLNRSFVCLFVGWLVGSFVRSFVRSFVCLYFHYQLCPISIWLVFYVRAYKMSLNLNLNKVFQFFALQLFAKF